MIKIKMPSAQNSYAEACIGSKGIADRITLVIGSDFGRTPFYNSGAGKDHWPVGSVIVMEKNAAWGDRVVGSTDNIQNARKINPGTLQRDESGTIIYPKHVRKALRGYLGLADDLRFAPFAFNNTEDFSFFNSSNVTTQASAGPSCGTSDNFGLASRDS
ncbi:MAG: DUF1501 domain-containing protein [Halieaceae bacterium]